MRKGYKQQTVRTVPSCELGEHREGGFRTLIVCTRRSWRKFLAQFEAILTAFVPPFKEHF